MFSREEDPHEVAGDRDMPNPNAPDIVEENEGKAKKLDFQNHETKRHLTEETDHEELLKYAQIHSSSFIGHKNWNIETLRTKVNAHKDREAAKAETLRKKTEAAEAK